MSIIAQRKKAGCIPWCLESGIGGIAMNSWFHVYACFRQRPKNSITPVTVSTLKAKILVSNYYFPLKGSTDVKTNSRAKIGKVYNEPRSCCSRKCLKELSHQPNLGQSELIINNDSDRL